MIRERAATPLGILVVLAWTAGCDSPSSPESSSMPWERITGRIAYVYHEEDHPPGFRIDVLNGAARRIERVAERAGTDIDWSPDGSRLVFHRFDEDFRYQLYTTDAAGESAPQPVLAPADPHAGHQTAPAWGPDGRIAYVYSGAVGQEIRVETDIVLEAGLDIEWGAGLEWSRTGGHLGFMVRNGQDRALMRVALATGSVEAILAGEDGWSVPKYSPDGSRMLLSSGREIWSMAVDGGDRARLTVSHADGGAEWSPDGSRIAFLRAGQIHIMNADGSDVVALPIHDVTEIEWSG